LAIDKLFRNQGFRTTQIIKIVFILYFFGMLFFKEIARNGVWHNITLIATRKLVKGGLWEKPFEMT